MVLSIRPATAADQDAIVTLVRSERLNPNGIDLQNFLVAMHGGRLIGAVQMRRHADGARELGSLVVERQARGQGLASQLVEALLAANPGQTFMITGKEHAAHFSGWSFRPIGAREAPASIRRNYRRGQVIGGAFAILQGRPINRLVILDRPDPEPSPPPGVPA